MAQLHSLLIANHRPYAGVYADAAERVAATGFVRALGGGVVAFTAEDLYKKALQLDDASEWVLTAITPTWVQVPGSLANDSVTNALLANMAQATIKGRASGAGTGDPVDLTATQATAILNNVVGDSGAGGTKGLVPAPAAGDAAAGKFLKADGTFAVPSGAGNVVGSASSTDNAVVRFNSTTGKLVQDSNLTVPDDAASTEVGYMNVPQNSQSADYTAVLADRGGHLYHPTSDDNPRTFTIPANASVAYGVGTVLTLVNDQNTLTIAITSDTLVWADDGSTGSRTLSENGIATAIKVTSTRWIISGVGLS